MQVKDYSDVVTHPMDLSTMRQKAESHQYSDIDDLEKDFELMINNCLAYNSKDTIFYKAALKLRDQVICNRKRYKFEKCYIILFNVSNVRSPF